MSDGPGPADPDRIETFQSRSGAASWLDLQPLWRLGASGSGPPPRLPAPEPSARAADMVAAPAALTHPWGAKHRPDWAGRGLIIWPRGRLWWRLTLTCVCPQAWRQRAAGAARARLVLRWWADQALLLADGQPVRAGDLFDTACRWELPESWWRGQPLQLDLWLRSPLHDDGALVRSRIELEPLDPADPLGLLEPDKQGLQDLRRAAGRPPAAALMPGPGQVHLLGHAHLDLAWLWPVADTWQAAERTFRSVLALMDRFPQLHFGHSTPALYAWLEEQRPALFARVRQAMRAGRWEPLNGPWVETDCVLISTASLLRQFQEGQAYSRDRFPEWEHALAWLPDSFGFAAGLPAVARSTGVRWFCTHKLAWNATNPFPHRLFRWRSRCGSELLALLTAPIGTDGDPQAIETERLAWQASSGVDDLLWLPGMGDHGGGPTAEMLEQLALWQHQSCAAPQRHGTLRQYLGSLESLAPQLPVWRDELYLELHRGCATSRPDQKRHNRSLERLLREAELARALAAALAPAAGGSAIGSARADNGAPGSSAASTDWSPLPSQPQEQAFRPAAGAGEATAKGAGRPARVAAAGAAVDWRPLLFQQFHDILPGTSIPEVFEQAEPQWRAARRQARRQRDGALAALLGSPGAGGGKPAQPSPPARGLAGPAGLPDAGDHPGPAAHCGSSQDWVVVQLQPLAAQPRTLRLPSGRWALVTPEALLALPQQAAQAGGCWLQLPSLAGVSVVGLRRWPAQPPAAQACSQAAGAAAGDGGAGATGIGARPDVAAIAGEAEPAATPARAVQRSAAACPPAVDASRGSIGPGTGRPAAPAVRSAVAGSLGEAMAAAGETPGGIPTAAATGRTAAPSGLDSDDVPQPLGPVRLEALAGPDGGRWRLANDHLAVTLGPRGIEQLEDAAGRSLLAAPLRWQRWRDAGEFWDAWDLAADHRQQPLPWQWLGEPLWLEQGPLCAHVVWRGRCGRSPVRLDARLQAGCPWLELVFSTHWRQRHELLQLELPLAHPARRWATDTAGGVIERPAEPRTPAEQARWEVAAVSWLAALADPQPQSPDLAVLLDGPQGVSAAPERLSLSLLRAPTWPDPGADNGWQRQRLALMPCPGGWRQAAVPAQARRLREPLWLRPSAAAGRPPSAQLWPALPPDLELVQLRERPGGAGDLLLALQNGGPCRRRLSLPPPWQLLERLDGLGEPLSPQPQEPAVLGPWELGFWRVRGAGAPG